MLSAKITKTWEQSEGKWMFQRHVAYLDRDGFMQTVLLLGWSVKEVADKTDLLMAALEAKDE